MVLESNQFKNSAACKGVSYTAEPAPVDMAVIDITGRYPDRGWAVNRVVHEIVYVQRGVGSLAIKGSEVMNLQEGLVVSVAPGERFAWDGDMIIVMACSPPFDPEQYTLEEQDEV